MRLDVESNYKLANVRTSASQSAGASNQPDDNGIDLMEEYSDGLREWVRGGFLLIEVTVVGSGGTLTLVVQDSSDGSTWDADFITATAISATGIYAIPIKDFARYIRVNATVATAAITWGAQFIGVLNGKAPVKQSDVTFLDTTYAEGR